MSRPLQPPPPPPAPIPSPAPRAERWSILAILSNASLLVPLLGPIVAMFLGAVALVRLRRQEREGGARIRGRRLAYVGLGAGAALLLIESYLYDAFARSVSAQIDAQVAAAVGDVFAVDESTEAKSVASRWSPHARDLITADDVAAFAAAIRERYGGFRSMSVVASDSPEFSLERQAVSTAVAFRFEGGERMGAMVTVLEPNPLSPFHPSPRLAEITVDDRAAGTLRLGPAPQPRTPSPGLSDPAPIREAADAH
ncbi:MAG: hypothetical protein SGJ09_00645 [Phycisphaerae bacterium]|nr:hypothetical protein [Phycisphaerae bacterium]